MDPLAGLLEDTWRIYRRHAGHLLGVAFAIYLPAAIFAGLLAFAVGGFGKLLGAVVQTCAAFLLEAALVKAVQEIRDGRNPSAGETIKAAVPDLASVAVASVVAGVAIWVGLCLVIVPGLYLLTIWAVVMPVIMIERAGAIAAFGRSRQLVRGHGWQVFGTLVLLFAILILLGLALGSFFIALPDAVRGGLGNIVLGTLVAPYIAVAVTLMYYRLTASAARTP
jgi:hypothetical protein